MLKISEPPAHHAITLKLEGRLIGPWVNELRTTCETYLASQRPVKLDFAEVAFADRNGVSLLLNLQSRGVELLNCSPFLAEELKAEV